VGIEPTSVVWWCDANATGSSVGRIVRPLCLFYALIRSDRNPNRPTRICEFAGFRRFSRRIIGRSQRPNRPHNPKVVTSNLTPATISMDSPGRLAGVLP
jgi:hypothetical protein